jgi:YD repeat-containing protein
LLQNGKDFVEWPFQDLAGQADKLQLVKPVQVAATGGSQGGGGAWNGATGDASSRPAEGHWILGEAFGGSIPAGGQGNGNYAPPAPPQSLTNNSPLATTFGSPAGAGAPGSANQKALPPSPAHTGSGQPTSPNSGPGSGLLGAQPYVTSGNLTLAVLDQYNGLVVSPNVSVNDFSNYYVEVDAQVIGGSKTTAYSWDLTNASDATGSSGASTYRLTFHWGNFTGTRTDTVKITATNNGDQASESITFIVAGTDSPAYTASQPTTPSTWLNLLLPDATTAQQTLGGQGPYYQVGISDGELQTTHTLPAYNPNVPPLQLMYISTAADPKPTFVYHYQLDPSQSLPPSITASLSFNGSAATSSTYNMATSTPTYLMPGDTLQLALQANATSLATGRYSYMAQVNVNTPRPPPSFSLSGSVDVLNYGSNAYGAGWSLQGVQQIFSATGGVILDLGDGQSLWFANGVMSGTYVTPPGDFSTLSKNTMTNVYTRTMPDGTKINFDSNGYQTSVVDRNGNTTTYGRNASHNITTITDLNSQVATLAYSGTGYLTSITDPANRLATLTFDGSGRLTSIKDADGSLWTYGYDSNKNLTQLTNPDNYSTTFAYSHDRLTSLTRPDTSTEAFTPVQLQGYPAGGSNVPPLLALAPGLSTDPNSNVSNTFLDWLGFGETVQSIDALNDTSLIHRDSNGLAWMPADPLAHRTRDFFDSNGNVTKHVQADDSYQAYTYNSFSEVLQTTDARGNLSTAAYDTHGNMTQFKDALGDLSTYTYSSKGFQTTSTDALNHTTTYSLDSLNRTTAVTDALGNTSTSLYDSASNLTTSIDPLNHRTTYMYDLLSRQTQVTDALSDITTSLYDQAGNLTTSIDARGDRTSYAFDKLNRQTQSKDALGDLSTSIYDKNGNLTTSLDPLGHRVSYSFDAANRQTQQQDALSNYTTTVFDAAGNVVASVDGRGDRTTYAFDSRNRQTAVQDALANLSTTLYDANSNVTTSIDARGNRTTTTFDALNRATTVKDALADVTTTLYDAVGNATTTIDARGDTTTFAFDADNRLTMTTDALTHLSTSVYDQAGNVTTRIDQLGHRTSYTYDALNRQTATQDALTNRTTTVFDSAGNVLASVDALGNRTSYTYDALNRATQTQDAATNLSTTIFDAAGNLTTSIDARGNRTTTAYDADNRQTAVTDPLNHTVTSVYDSAGNVTARTDAGGFTTTYAFDKLNRQTSVEDPGTGVATTVYDSAGNVTNSIGQMGDKTTYVYDALNRQTTTIDAKGGLTTTVFDAVGNTVNVIDPVGNKTTMVYDVLNRETQMTDPLGHRGTMAFDGASRLTSATDRDGNVINYSYDAINRKTAETWTQSSVTVNTLTYLYDANGNLLTAANSAGTYTMGYDTLNRMTANQEPYGLSLTYSYDPVGDRTQVQDSLSGVLTSVYDMANRLTSRKFGGTSQTPLRIDLTYTARNQIATETRYSDLAGSTVVGSSTFTYDALGRETNLQHYNSSAIMANYTYTFDLASRLTSEQDNERHQHRLRLRRHQPTYQCRQHELHVRPERQPDHDRLFDRDGQ